jgi:hypothetical protein
MRLYLAARYSRRLELCDYRAILNGIGHNVRARWLDGAHQIGNDGVPLGDEGERAVESETDDHAAMRRKFLADDVQDVRGCEGFIAFTEEPRTSTSRGGRHVELGIMLERVESWRGYSRPVIAIVGPRENLFCWHQSISVFASFNALLASGLLRAPGVTETCP